MTETLLAASGIDLVQLGMVAMTSIGLGLTAVSTKIGRDTLKANKTAVEIAAEGIVHFDSTIVENEIHLTNQALAVKIHGLWITFDREPVTSRDEFVDGAQELNGRRGLLDEGETLKVSLAPTHLERLRLSAMRALLGIEFSIIDGAKHFRSLPLIGGAR